MIDIKNLEKDMLSFLPQNLVLEKDLVNSMVYSLQAGGKRVRASLVLEFANLCGGEYADAIFPAVAVECIHTYSLIHDDLPCMDDDDYRRGKLSNHKVYGEDIALLSGDALQSLAFEILSSKEFSKKVGAEKALRCVNILSSCCGAKGMVGGQVIDLQSENKQVPLEVITELHNKKTGALIKSACMMGCVCGGSSEEEIKAAEKYGECIGLAFQIMDDILDVTSTQEQLGKPIGSDMENQKSTYVSLLGIEKSKKLINELTNQAIKALECFKGDSSSLTQFAIKLSKREK